MKSNQNSYSNPKKGNIFYFTGLVIFVFILIFNGTFFRIRPEEDIPTLDWLILARLLSSAIGFLVGLVLLIKANPRIKFGSAVLIFFLLSTIISAINTPYPTIVIGYALLLFGASVLVFGLVQSASNINQLKEIEWIWFITVAICVIKDALTSVIHPAPEIGGEVVRLGMSTTHANQISLLAGLVFWLSFRETKAKVIFWFLRIAMFFIILGAISRVGITAFLLGGITYYFLRLKNFNQKAVYTLTLLSGIITFLLATSLYPQLGEKIILYAKRGQTQAELAHFTGRTDIWKQVLSQVSESPLIGHGYGITRFTLKPTSWNYQPPHAHNEFLEALFCTGIVGLIPLVLLYLYNLKWLGYFYQLKNIFSSELALHASAVMVMFLVSTFFEARISVRLLPFQPLFFFYLLLLDREKEFTILKVKER